MGIINLEALSEDIDSKNPSSNYMPVRTNYNECEWNSVSALFTSGALGLELKNYSVEEFKSDCEATFKEKLDKEDFWYVLDKAYFEREDILKVAPHCLLLKANKKKTAPADQRVATVLRSLMGDQRINFRLENKLNFIERIFINVLKKKWTESPSYQADEPYLPFMSDCFRRDIKFLSEQPRYFLEQLPSFLSLYTFLYTSQLALNLPEWRAGIPKPKPLYFILDTERASSERTEIRHSGWDSFRTAAYAIFPLLSMLEVLQVPGAPKQPLWKIIEYLDACVDDSVYLNSFKDYALRFKDERGIRKETPESDTAIGWLETLLQLGKDQFDKSYADPGSTRYQANQKVVAAIIEYIASSFIQNRGRAGKVLVLNQDNLLLLTNIAIGDYNRLRLIELIEAFEQRGVFFDKQSQQRLVEFYERIGNVERMSDSGEAVYVLRTI